MPVRSATFADVDAVVAIHCGALAQDVAPAFGARFLTQFYRRLLSSVDHVLLVATEGDEVRGFCALAMQPPPLRAALRPHDLFRFTRRVIVSPGLLASAVIQARHPTVADWERSAEIAFVAVDGGHTSQGYGGKLLRVATAAATAGGKQTVVTKTANSALAEFYRRDFQAVVVRRFAAAGLTYLVLEWEASQGGPLADRDP